MTDTPNLVQRAEKLIRAFKVEHGLPPDKLIGLEEEMILAEESLARVALRPGALASLHAHERKMTDAEVARLGEEEADRIQRKWHEHHDGGNGHKAVKPLPVTGDETRPALGVNYTRPPAEKPAPPRFSLVVTNIGDLLTREWPDPVFAVEGILPVGLTVLAGKSKVGKSWLCLQLAQSVATGGRFLGVQVKQGKTLYLALEDSPRRIADRAKRQGWPAGNRNCDIVHMAAARTLWPLKRANAEKLAQVIEDQGYSLVVIDTFSRMAQGDQNKVDEMTNALAPLQEVANRLQVAVVLVDHHSKANRDEKTLDPVLDVLGSTGKGAVADNLMGLYKHQGVAGATLAIRGRDVEDKRFQLRFDVMTACWQIEGERPLGDAQRKVLDAVTAIPDATLSDVCQALERDRSNTYRTLQELVERGLLSRNGDTYRVIDNKSTEVGTTGYNAEVGTTGYNGTTRVVPVVPVVPTSPLQQVQPDTVPGDGQVDDPYGEMSLFEVGATLDERSI